MVSAALFLKLPTENFYAFDSFEGLPMEDDMGIFKPGTFSTSVSNFKKIIKKQNKIRLRDDQTIVGFYDQTLTARLAQSLPTPSIIHVDVDLYESTKDILVFLNYFDWKKLVIVFDDWYCFSPAQLNGEKKAFTEFLEQNPDIKSEPWKSYSTFGKSFFLWRD